MLSRDMSARLATQPLTTSFSAAVREAYETEGDFEENLQRSEWFQITFVTSVDATERTMRSDVEGLDATEHAQLCVEALYAEAVATSRTPTPAPELVPLPNVRDLIAAKDIIALQALSGRFPILGRLPFVGRTLSAYLNRNCSFVAINFMLGYARGKPIPVAPWHLFGRILSDAIEHSGVRCRLPKIPTSPEDPRVIEFDDETPPRPTAAEEADEEHADTDEDDDRTIPMYAPISSHSLPIAYEFEGLLNRNGLGIEGLWRLFTEMATFDPPIHRVFAIGGDRRGRVTLGNHAFNAIVSPRLIQIVDVRYGEIIDFRCEPFEGMARMATVPEVLAKRMERYKILLVYEACVT